MRPRTRALIAMTLGFGATVASAWGPAALLAWRPWDLNVRVVAADARNIEGQPAVVWSAIAGADLLASFRARNAFFSGIPLIVAPSLFDDWRSLPTPPPNLSDWESPLGPPWNEEHGNTIVAGWPVRALTGTTFVRRVHTPPQEELESTSGIPMGPWSTPLPLRPLWAGLLLDTVVWSLAIFVAGTAIGAIRRAFRRRQGCCPRCGHTAAPGQRMCPECGSTETPVDACPATPAG